MANLDRILELAGLKDKSLHVTPLHEKTLEQLKHEKLCYEQQIKGVSIVTEALSNIRLKLFNVEKAIIDKKKSIYEAAMANLKEPCSNCQKTTHNDETCTCDCHDQSINEHLTKVNGRWALVSKKTGRPLRYYKGEGKPSDEWVKSQEKSIQYFKNMGEDKFHLEFNCPDCKEEWTTDSTVEKDDECPKCGTVSKPKKVVTEDQEDSNGNEIRVDTWFERDRANVTVYKNDKEIAEWWDDDVRELVEDGFLNPRDWEGSAIEYCKHLGLLESEQVNEVAPEDQEDFVKKAKEDFKKRYGKRWKKVLYATAWKKHNEGLTGDTFEIADKLIEESAMDGAELQDAQPTSALGKDKIDNIFNGHDEEKSNQMELQQDAQGITQDRETKVVVPADVFAQIEQRIKELKQSIELYDKTTYKEQYGNKQKAIENLEFIRDKLKMGNMEGYKQAQIHYGTLASLYAGNLFPAKLVDFLHDGQASEKREVAFGDYMKGTSDKPSESDVPGNSIYKTLNTSIYPQKGEDNVPKK